MLTIVVSLLVIVISVYILSIVTEEFFIESLDVISKKWQLPNNVAGASLMAMGSSAPELAIALIALFSDGGAHSDVGLGTIIGSAVFNILVITGASAIVRPAEVSLKVVLRDSIIYVGSIGLLLVAFQDAQISMIEAVVFLLYYAIYIVILFQWERFVPSNEPDPEPEVHSEETHDNPNLYHRVTAVVSKGLGLFMGHPRKAFIRTFIISILIICAISYLLVESAVAFADALSIPPVIVALTILAGGTSVPDLISSMVVARQGRGDMAVANAIGSNIFDILVGLGLPWMIVLLMGESHVAVDSGNLWGSTLILLGTVFLLFVFLVTGRRLSRAEGWCLLAVYVGYVIFAWFGG